MSNFIDAMGRMCEAHGDDRAYIMPRNYLIDGLSARFYIDKETIAAVLDDLQRKV